MDWMFYVVPAIFVVIFVFSVLRSLRKRKAEREGKIMVGTVVSVSGTGSYTNQQPNLRVLLDLKDASGQSGQATLSDTFPLSNMPKVGDTYVVVLNPRDPTEAFLANKKAMDRDDRTLTVVRDTAAVPASMRGNPPQVGDIMAIKPVGDGTDSYQVDVVRIGQAPTTVFCQQSFADGNPYAVGDRVYLVTDNQTPPRNGYIMPLSFGGGAKLTSTGNRADMVVGDALLFAGAKAQGTLLAYSLLPLPPAYASKTVSKWSLDFRIQPEDGSAAYDGTCTLAVISKEHAALVTEVGKQLPLRYDPFDKPTFVVDGIALGFGDPALIRQQMKQLHLAEQGTS